MRPSGASIRKFNELRSPEFAPDDRAELPRDSYNCGSSGDVCYVPESMRLVSYGLLQAQITIPEDLITHFMEVCEPENAQLDSMALDRNDERAQRRHRPSARNPDRPPQTRSRQTQSHGRNRLTRVVATVRFVNQRRAIAEHPASN
jgi:hypothetical protein